MVISYLVELIPEHLASWNPCFGCKIPIHGLSVNQNTGKKTHRFHGVCLRNYLQRSKKMLPVISDLKVVGNIPKNYLDELNEQFLPTRDDDSESNSENINDSNYATKTVGVSQAKVLIKDKSNQAEESKQSTLLYLERGTENERFVEFCITDNVAVIRSGKSGNVKTIHDELVQFENHAQALKTVTHWASMYKTINYKS